MSDDAFPRTLSICLRTLSIISFKNDRENEKKTQISKSKKKKFKKKKFKKKSCGSVPKHRDKKSKYFLFRAQVLT